MRVSESSFDIHPYAAPLARSKIPSESLRLWLTPSGSLATLVFVASRWVWLGYYIPAFRSSSCFLTVGEKFSAYSSIGNSSL